MLIAQPDYLPTSDNYSAIKKKIDADYSANQSIWQIYWTEATIDSRLEAGDISLMSELSQGLPTNRSSFYFNRVRPLCNMVSGHQRSNRKSSIVVPLENADQKTADQLSKILLGIYKREDVYETISDAFHQGACIAGMNLLHVYIDYQNDPISGDIKVDNCSYNSFFIDPYFRKPDLSDCSFVWRRSYLSHSAAAALIPDKYEEIMALPGNPTGTGRDGRFQYMPESYGQTQQNRIAYDEYYYRSYRKQKLFIDKKTGDTLEVPTVDPIDTQTFLEHYPEVEIEERDVPTVRLAIMVQDKIMYDGPNPLGVDCFPFVPVIGYYNPMMPYFYTRIQGICRSLRDPQLLLNRRIILSADMLESQVNSGFIFKENAPVDIKHLFQTGQGRIIPLKEEAAMTDIVPIIPPQIPPSFFQLQETFAKELNMVSGINEELMGTSNDDTISGLMSAMKQSNGLITLKPLFDKLDHSQNRLGDLIIKVAQANYTPGKIKNILEGDEPAPLFYNKAFGKYHCAVELGLNTESQRQMQFAQLLKLKELGVPLPDSALIEAATIQDKTKIIEQMQQAQQQAQQAAQAQQQIQMQLQQSQTELAHSRAMADQGLYAERTSRVAENQALAVERMAQANKDDEIALLNKVKMLKELEDMDLSHLERLFAMANELKAQESVQAQAQAKQTPQVQQNSSAALDRG
jgi:hypothetical protein